MKLLVTGANRGLGLSLVAEGAKRGHIVIAGVRNPEQNSESLLKLQSAYPDQIQIVSLDVTDEASCQEAASKVKEYSSYIDVIVNNAGILTERDKTIEDLNIREVHKTFEVNLYGPMRVVKYFLPIVDQKHASAIINISSEAGSFKNAYGGDYPYAISKHAVNMFTQQLHRYLSDTSMLVLSIHPGWIKTDMGGEKAPGSPEETAKGVLDLIERKKEVPKENTFINFKGEPMPF